MRVGVIQSSFIPWRGYFDFIASVDIFVFYDDLQYTKGDWRNRNKIKTSKGTKWITVPVHHQSISQLICETQIFHDQAWAKKHFQLWQSHYKNTAHLDDVMEILSIIESKNNSTISQLNIELIQRICNYLGIDTPLVTSHDFGLKGCKTDRLIDLLTKLNARTYLSGPSADAYLDKKAFQDNGIRLEYKTYDYEPYPQQWGDFNGAVTILDLIANCGAASKKYIHSQQPNTVIVL